MKLPPVERPERLCGLYVYDFGQWAAVGYTADEIAILLESPEYRGGKVYKIHRARPTGEMELRGVSGERFQLESGMFFYRADVEQARTDFAELRDAAERTLPPCRVSLHLADRRPALAGTEFVTALVYPAEFDEEMGTWLATIGFPGGDSAEGGSSHVSNYNVEQKIILEREQLWSQPAIPSRDAEEVLASVRRAVQR